MPRANLSVSLLSTHSSGVDKKYLPIAVGRSYSFISQQKFRNITGPCEIVIKKLYRLSVNGNVFSNNREILVGNLSDQPCYWNVSDIATLLNITGYVSGSATCFDTIIVGYVNPSNTENTEIPCYWGNYLELNILSRTVSEITYDYGKVFNIHEGIMVGYVNETTNVDNAIPCYWNESRNLRTLNISGYVGGQAYCIYGDIIVGYVLDEDNHKNPCYWNYTIELFEPSLLFTPYVNGEATYIHGDIIVGFVNNTIDLENPQPNIPCYWVSGVQYILPTLQFVSGIATSVFNKNKVGFVEDENQNKFPCYWDSSDNLYILENTGFGIANCIYNNKIVGYIINENTDPQAAYWII